jgi:hypothetical protein
MSGFARIAFSVSLVLTGLSGPALAGQYTKGPWKFTLDEAKGTLSVSHAKLGVVLQNARLEVSQSGRLVASSQWTVADRGASAIAITAKAPAAATWEFKTGENAIDVSTAAAGSVISAAAPATAQRITARLAEPDKMQSKIAGKEIDYTGFPMEERFYIPPDSAEVMFLALGPVDALNVHGLFDRPTDIAIRFAADSRLSRDPADAQLLRVVQPLSASTSLLSLMPDYYVKVLGNPRYVPLDDKIHKTAATGWNHWLAFFRDVNEPVSYTQLRAHET